jgi:hypothetical protein
MANEGNNRANIAACQRVLASDMRCYGIIFHYCDSMALFLWKCVSMLTGEMMRDGTFNQEVAGSIPAALTSESRV